MVVPVGLATITSVILLQEIAFAVVCVRCKLRLIILAMFVAFENGGKTTNRSITKRILG